MELQGGIWPELLAVSLGTVLGLAAVSAMEQHYRFYADPSTSRRIKDAAASFGEELLYLLIRIAAVLLAILLFVAGVLLYPPRDSEK